MACKQSSSLDDDEALLQTLWQYVMIGLGMYPANEIRRYNVMTSLIGRAHI